VAVVALEQGARHGALTERDDEQEVKRDIDTSRATHDHTHDLGLALPSNPEP